MYTLNEVAMICKVKVRTVREWLKLGKIKAVKMGKRWYVPQDELNKMTKGQ